MSRFTNKTLFCSCLKSINQWARDGNRRLRFDLLMNLGDPEDEDRTEDEDEDKTPVERPDTTAELLSEMAFEVANALVLYSVQCGKRAFGVE